MAIVGEADSGCSEEDEKWKVLIGCFRSLNKYKEVLGVVSSYKKEFRIFHCKIVSKGIIEVGEISFPIQRSPLGYADQIQKLIEHISVHLLKLSSQKPDETVPDVFTSGKDYVSKECKHIGLYVGPNEKYVAEKFGNKYYTEVYLQARANKRGLAGACSTPGPWPSKSPKKY